MCRDGAVCQVRFGRGSSRSGDVATSPADDGERVAAVDEALDLAYRRDRPRVLATLVGLLRDFDLAEDALHDALLSATTAWKERGVPANPPGWLVTVARRKAIDRLRSSVAAERRH